MAVNRRKSFFDSIIAQVRDGTEDTDYEIRYDNDSKQWVVDVYQTGYKCMEYTSTIPGLGMLPIGYLIPTDEIVLFDEKELLWGQLEYRLQTHDIIQAEASVRIGNSRDLVYSKPLRQDEIARLVQNDDGKWIIDGRSPNSIPDARLSNGRLNPFRSFFNKDGVPTTQAAIEKVSLAVLEVGMSSKNRYASLVGLLALWSVPMHSIHGSVARDAMVALGILTPTPTAREQRHPAVVGGKIAHDREAKGKFWANVGKWTGRLAGIAAGIAFGVAVVMTGGTALVIGIALAVVKVAAEAGGAFVESAMDQTAFETGDILEEEKHPNVFLNGNRVARLGTPVKCKKEHPDLAYNAFIEGSKTVFINGRPMVRVGHKTSCGAFAFKGETYVQTGLWTTVHDVPVEGFHEIWNAISKDLDNGYNMDSWLIGLLVSSTPERPRKRSPLYGPVRNTDPLGNPGRKYDNLPETPLEKTLQDPFEKLVVWSKNPWLRANDPALNSAVLLEKLRILRALMRPQNAKRGGVGQQPTPTTPPPLPPTGNQGRSTSIGLPIENHYSLPPTSISSMGSLHRPMPSPPPFESYLGRPTSSPTDRTWHDRNVPIPPSHEIHMESPKPASQSFEEYVKTLRRGGNRSK